MADFDLGSLLSSLSPEDMENLKKTATQVLGNMGSVAPEPAKAQQSSQVDFQNNGGIANALAGLGDLGMPDLSQLAGLLPVLQTLNAGDERLDFINALKPMLSPEKRKKADEALKLVRLLAVIPILKERGLLL